MNLSCQLLASGGPELWAWVCPVRAHFVSQIPAHGKLPGSRSPSAPERRALWGHGTEQRPCALRHGPRRDLLLSGQDVWPLRLGLASPRSLQAPVRPGKPPAGLQLVGTPSCGQEAQSPCRFGVGFIFQHLSSFKKERQILWHVFIYCSVTVK